MKKVRINAFTIIAYMLILITFGCKKDLREVQVATTNDEENLTEVTSAACSVVSIKGNSQKAVFTYDSYGNPVSIIVDHAQTGEPDYQFKYDAKHHLIDLIGYYPPYGHSFEIWHNYHYNSKHQINADTVYTLGEFGEDGQPKNYIDKYLVHFTYDLLGRIIKEKDSYGDAYHYNYDSNGNLVNGSTYDHKKNIHRTNPLWQFIDRDYSVNNPEITTSYSHGYPGKVEGRFYFVGTYYWSGTTAIKYSCY